ncbi:hypothetical protein ACP3VU_00365 [Vibrio sp. PNB23_22_6]
MGIEQLENKGFAFLNTENINVDKRQIVIVGSARGGTSLVAGALHHLGIFTGEKSNAPVFEDVLLSEAFENNDIELAKEISQKYTNDHDVWAWKRPAALNYLDKVEEVIPNPFYIYIFKDIFAIANRNSISMQSDISKGMQQALIDYGKIVDFISKSDKPIMLVSAEKALQNKADFVNALVEANKEFLGELIPIDNAINFIEPNSKQYLDATRITKAEGRVDLVSDTKIIGYAMHVHNKNKPVIVELYLGNEIYRSVIADEYRLNIHECGKHPTGKCGFSFEIDKVLREAEQQITIKVKDEVTELNNGKFNIIDAQKLQS